MQVKFHCWDGATKKNRAGGEVDRANNRWSILLTWDSVTLPNENSQTDNANSCSLCLFSYVSAFVACIFEKTRQWRWSDSSSLGWEWAKRCRCPKAGLCIHIMAIMKINSVCVGSACSVFIISFWRFACTRPFHNFFCVNLLYKTVQANGFESFYIFC